MPSSDAYYIILYSLMHIRSCKFCYTFSMHMQLASQPICKGNSYTMISITCNQYFVEIQKELLKQNISHVGQSSYS